jgi:hypothetical protein
MICYHLTGETKGTAIETMYGKYKCCIREGEEGNLAMRQILN